MLNKLFFAAIPLLFVGATAFAEDIVYDNDWRAGETGYVTGDKADNSEYSATSTQTVDYSTPYQTADKVHYDGDWRFGSVTPDHHFRDQRMQVSRDDRQASDLHFQDKRDDKSLNVNEPNVDAATNTNYK